MIQILQSFDAELVERAKAALNEAHIGFTAIDIDEEPLRGWRIDVEDVESAKSALIIEALAQALESERSLMRCSHCGTGMIVVTRPDQDGLEPTFIEYRCPKCGAPGLSNVS